MSDLLSQLVQFTSATRLYSLRLGKDDGAGEFMVEAFAASEGLHAVGVREVIALHLDASVPLKTLLGQKAVLETSLSDGTRASFSGLVSEAAKLGSEGGFARYRIRIVPWIWLLSQSRNSRVWQDKSVIEIVDDVFSEYAGHADWSWSDEVVPFMQAVQPRSYTIQYRESNLDFVSRLLAAEGLSWRVEEAGSAPAGHRLVLFADSSIESSVPEDATSASVLGGEGIRFHAGTAREEQDSIQALAARRSLQPATYSLLSYDYKNKQAVATSLPTRHEFGGKDAPRLESFDSPGQYAFTDAAEADHYAQLHLEASEARNKSWQGRSTVRTLRPGTRFSLTQGPLGNMAGDDTGLRNFCVLSVFSVGINNLPKDAEEGLAELFGPIVALLEECIGACQGAQQQLQGKNRPDSLNLAAQADLGGVISQARKLGYANAFEAIRLDVVWRPVLADGTGRRLHPRATAQGSQSAIVVGANGETTASGSDEIHCDKLGRVRIRFHWQGRNNDASATCWVRVVQRAAGAGIGMQFLPRIGQEVLVQFIEDDIDRPVIVGALYNGQGEGAAAPTPGGASADDQPQSKVFAGANDLKASGQGNSVGGNGPTWHGGSQDNDGHRNPATQWGIRSKEFGGNGYNQMLFDDTDSQGRLQLKSTQSGTELNLGHLIHSADNYRGSFRGTGAELRTDAYGAVRAGNGILFSSYKVQHSAADRDPAWDNAGGQALLKQAALLGKSFNEAAVTHKTVALAAQIGPQKANANIISDTGAPLEAMRVASAGMVDSASDEVAAQDLASANTRTGDSKVPHTTSALIGIAAREGFGAVAGQHLQWVNEEAVSLMSGHDSQQVSGNQFRLQSGQAIGMLAGAMAAGDSGVGLQVVAAQHNIDVQAQADTITVQARDQLSVVSANASIDWAAAKKISLTTAGGANITIDGGNITVRCPGKLTIHAAQKLFVGPDRLDVPMPPMPNSVCKECILNAMKQGAPGVLV